MKSYSQNGEDLFVIDYFKGFKGTLLEIGANDGETLSNSLLLIENGWKAHLVEPSSMFDRLVALHGDNPNVTLHNYAIGGLIPSEMTFYESEAHVPGGSDLALVSTLDFEETLRWRNAGVKFHERKVPVKPYDLKEQFDFISIDAEGYDEIILSQIDLSPTSCLCIEFNGMFDTKARIINYCATYGLKLVHVNNENLIFTR